MKTRILSPFLPSCALHFSILKLVQVADSETEPRRRGTTVSMHETRSYWSLVLFSLAVDVTLTVLCVHVTEQPLWYFLLLVDTVLCLFLPLSFSALPVCDRDGVSAWTAASRARVMAWIAASKYVTVTVKFPLVFFGWNRLSSVDASLLNAFFASYFVLIASMCYAPFLPRLNSYLGECSRIWNCSLHSPYMLSARDAKRGQRSSSVLP